MYRVMITDLSVKANVLDELEWQPDIDETNIGIAVKDGIVTLTGIVDSYIKKREAENAAKSVLGVRAVANNIEVQYSNNFKKTDTEIAASAVNALKWNILVPADKITVKVDDGWIYLTGEVKWAFERNAAQKAVEKLPSIKHVVNNITIKNTVDAGDIKSKIQKAFERSADIDAKGITVKADGHTVKLTGKVRSLKEKENAKKTAYHAPGVWNVEDELEVVV